MYAATTKDEGNDADGRFSTACLGLTILATYSAIRVPCLREAASAKAGEIRIRGSCNKFIQKSQFNL